MANRRVYLQQLPIEIVTEIVKNVGRASSADYCNARSTCRLMREASNDERVLFCLCLSPLVKKPLLALSHKQILDKCVEVENYAGFFIQGILSYFTENDPVNGMGYLQLAAIGDGDDLILEAAYLYGVLCLLHDNDDEGKEFMDKMNWKGDDDLKTTNEVWKKLRKLLHGINVTKKDVYLQSLENMMPPESCHRRDFEIVCPDCFYYKRAVKFYHMM